MGCSGSEGSAPDTGPGATARSDAGPSCSVVDAQRALVDVTNEASEMMTINIDVEFVDEGGAQLSVQKTFFEYLAPGERTQELIPVIGGVDAAACKVVVTRSELVSSADDTETVTCEVVGSRLVDQLDLRFTATNNTASPIDVSTQAALMRDGVRIGDGFTSFRAVPAGETVTDIGFTAVTGPVDSVRCTVISVKLS